MKNKILIAAKIFIGVLFLFAAQEGKCFANPIDIFIGQLNSERPIEALGAGDIYRGKLFILWSNDRVIIEINNETEEVFLVGVYSSAPNPDLYLGGTSECMIPVKKVKIKDFSLYININNAEIKNCL